MESLSERPQETKPTNKPKGPLFKMFWAVLGMQPLVAICGDSFLPDKWLLTFKFVRLIYNFNTLVLPGILMVAFGILLVISYHSPENSGLASWGWSCLLFALCLISLRIYATHIEPHRLVVRNVTIQTPKVDRPIRILHVSDIQARTVGSYEERAFEKMRELKPDLVLHTGDLLQCHDGKWDKEIEKMCRLFQTLKAPLGVFSVYGDTDNRLRAKRLDTMGGPELLESQRKVLSFEGKEIALIGLSKEQSRFGAAEEVEDWTKAAGPDAFTIVMGHSPDYVRSVMNSSVDLCLAGHTHGGQVRIPFLGPIFTSSVLPKRFSRGFHNIGKTSLNVSAGVGAEHCMDVPVIRFNCPSEMTLIVLEPKPRTP